MGLKFWRLLQKKIERREVKAEQSEERREVDWGYDTVTFTSSAKRQADHLYMVVGRKDGVYEKRWVFANYSITSRNDLLPIESYCHLKGSMEEA